MAFLIGGAAGTPGSTGAFVRIMHVGDVSIDGDLTVTTLIATTTITTGDNCITLNDDVTGAPSEDAGIEIERGTSLNAEMKWIESADRWQAGEVGSLSNIVREVDLSSTDASITIVGSDFSVNFPADNGEDNTASNVGAGGVGLFKQKILVDLEFKNINAGSSKITITDDVANDEVDIDVDESNIVHQNLSGAGTNTHAQIDSHIADTSNPHSVTATQVGLDDTDDLAEGALNLYYTEARVSANVDVAANTADRHTHANKTELDLVSDGDHDVRTDNPHGTSFTQAVAADIGTDITAAEAETLTDGSNADALHVHAASLDDKVRVSTNDTTPGFLDAKITAGTGIVLTEIGDGGDEDLEISVDAAVLDHGALTGLADDDHLQYLTEVRHDALPSDNPHSVTASQVGLDDTDDLSEGATNLYYTEARVSANTDVAANTTARHSHANKVELDLVSDGDHDVRTDNPHGTTFTQAVTADAGTDITAAEAETLTDGSDANGLHTHEELAGLVNKEIFFTPPSAVNTFNNYVVTSVGTNSTFRISFAIPTDFGTLTSVQLIHAPAAGAVGTGKDIDLFSDYGAVGESSTNHSESDTTSTYDFGADTDFWVMTDVSSVFTSLTASDLCGLEWKNNSVGGALRILGLILKYQVA